MIGKNMFVGEPTINDYREISLEDVLKEHLYFKGTYDERNVRHNAVTPKELCNSALWIYGLKDNPTNRTNVMYYCERQARQNLWFKDGKIVIPDELWKECNEYNNKMCKKRSRVWATK